MIPNLVDYERRYIYRLNGKNEPIRSSTRFNKSTRSRVGWAEAGDMVFGDHRPSCHTHCRSVPLPYTSLERDWAERANISTANISTASLLRKKKKQTYVYSRNCEPFTPNPHLSFCKVCLAWKLRVYVFVPDYLDSPPSNQLSTCLRMPNVEGAPTDKILMFCKILFSMLGRITLHFKLDKVLYINLRSFMIFLQQITWPCYCSVAWNVKAVLQSGRDALTLKEKGPGLCGKRVRETGKGRKKKTMWTWVWCHGKCISRGDRWRAT